MKLYDNIFIVIVGAFFISGLIFTIFSYNDNNYYENRVANKLPSYSIRKFLNENFQNNVENAFSDQIPFTTTFKKIFNFYENSFIVNTKNIFLKDYCNKRYIYLGNNLLSFGCNNNLLTMRKSLDDSRESLDKKINNINEVMKNKDVDFYIFYIERDPDINFSNNKKANIFEYIKNNLETKNVYRFAINNFSEYEKNYYKTDHHWNHNGSYEGYKFLTKVLTREEPVKYSEELCFSKKFSGSRAKYKGVEKFYKEQFCVYNFLDLPQYAVYVNGKKGSYGKEYYNKNLDIEINYSKYYGYNTGEVIFDNLLKKRGKNILLIGDSFDNAIIKLLASHFDKTFSIDLRYYKESFDISEYIKENDIDKVLLIGSYSYFISEEFIIGD